ncbi:MAG: regulatory protein RecX [Candidatus Cohnella colombiensis]|uniref:Regulatory protein RecX n=1 Tax=Candidatus Cohnella colombiensis TaxID=3121368 RepID=A0AA95F084_9BACL|nr:MAG: regulatory protein RecX [Cohnella sp.]
MYNSKSKRLQAGSKGKSGYNKGVNNQVKRIDPTEFTGIASATVDTVEAHPKQSSMYRVSLQLTYVEGYERMDETHLHNQVEDTGENDWTDEVDALIASAADATKADEVVVTVHEDTLVSWRLLKGRQLTADQYVKLKVEEQKEEAYRAALQMLERKARTASELSKALKRKGFDPEAITGCLDRLKANRFIDDTAYAVRFTEQRAANHKKGRRLIRQELMQRGVERQQIEVAINQLDDRVEEQGALSLARKRWPTLKGNDREKKQKLLGVLLRRGYTGDVVKSAISQVVTESSEDEHWIDMDDVHEVITDDLLE